MLYRRPTTEHNVFERTKENYDTGQTTVTPQIPGLLQNKGRTIRKLVKSYTVQVSVLIRRVKRVKGPEEYNLTIDTRTSNLYFFLPTLGEGREWEKGKKEFNRKT